MGFGKNNVLPGNHFRKDWQRRVKTWFDQPGRKLRRRNARKAKAAALGVRPLTLLRPAVRGQTVRYNAKIREGRGFTLNELKEAGISRKTINIERLKAYKERLVVFPRKTGKPKKGDSSPDDLKAPTTRQTLPLPPPSVPEQPRKITQEEREFNAYKTLRNNRAETRFEGVRKIRAAKKEEEEAAKKK
ncbi:ribosomal protein L13e [Russula vinacea]|nr:ribosomal protein L13e [Russula vinacea]